MKKKVGFLSILMLGVAAVSCDFLGEDGQPQKGRLCLSFSDGEERLTKALESIPDTSEFLLTVKDASGNVIYDGLYGDCPESVDVNPGSYTVRVVSCNFDAPAFNSPQLGDDQCVLVPENGSCLVKLVCSQMNAGVRLNVASSFLAACPDAVLFLKSGKKKLMYSVSERRTAYFPPGVVSLVMNSGAADELLMTKEMNAGEMLTLGVSAVVSDVSAAASGMSVSIDTARVWLSEDVIVGGPQAGGDTDDALSVAQARTSAGREDVWVCGYIVGGDLSSASASFDEPFESRTNLVLGPRSSTVDKDACISVQLPSGSIRDALNLVDNPGLLGKRVCIKGDIVETYYGIPGLKNVSEYTLLQM